MLQDWIFGVISRDHVHDHAEVGHNIGKRGQNIREGRQTFREGGLMEIPIYIYLFLSNFLFFLVYLTVFTQHLY